MTINAKRLRRAADFLAKNGRDMMVKNPSLASDLELGANELVARVRRSGTSSMASIRRKLSMRKECNIKCSGWHLMYGKKQYDPKSHSAEREDEWSIVACTLCQWVKVGDNILTDDEAGRLPEAKDLIKRARRIKPWIKKS